MNTTTTRRRRYSVRTAAVATTAAVIFGAAACGSQTASDTGKAPAAPAAPAVKVQTGPHVSTSADALERRAAAERQQQFVQHYLAARKQRGPRSFMPGNGREILIP